MVGTKQSCITGLTAHLFMDTISKRKMVGASLFSRGGEGALGKDFRIHGQSGKKHVELNKNNGKNSGVSWKKWGDRAAPTVRND